VTRTNIDIDDKLVKEGLKIAYLRTKKELVPYALEELIKRNRRKRMLELEGKVEFANTVEDLIKQRRLS